MAAIPFNGATFSFGGTPVIPLVSIRYETSTAGIDVGGAADTTKVFEAGIPQETLTVEAIGSTLFSAKTTGAAAVTWSGGATTGSMTSAILTKVSDGGAIDDKITTTYTFQPTT